MLNRFVNFIYVRDNRKRKGLIFCCRKHSRKLHTCPHPSEHYGLHIIMVIIIIHRPVNMKRDYFCTVFLYATQKYKIRPVHFQVTLLLADSRKDIGL